MNVFLPVALAILLPLSLVPREHQERDGMVIFEAEDHHAKTGAWK